MKKNTVFGLALLVSASSMCLHVFGQSDYTYIKGKSFKNTRSLFINDTINLVAPVPTVIYKESVPEPTQTVSLPLRLPGYVRGIFFSRDSRPGDFKWPNNTNRLLPWAFNELKDITDEHYAGIPSNAAPSALGDALLLELDNGTFLFAKAVSGTNSLSWMQINDDGSIALYASTLGKDCLRSKVPLLLVGQARSGYEAIRNAYQCLMDDAQAADLKKRTDKEYFEAFRYLGWCTWEHYHADIDEAAILNDLQKIEASGIPVRYVLIDDGHLASKNRQLSSFKAETRRFPYGWKNIIRQKKEDGIRWMGLWYALSGYWMGISPDNDFPEQIRQTLYRHNDCLLPGTDSADIHAFYKYYVQTLKAEGFDFLKVDNQSFTLPLYMGGTECIRQATDCNRYLEVETHRQSMGLMNCMAHNVLNTDHTLHSNSTRVSIDYKKYDENMAKSHLFQSYTNTLLLGQTVWPDHDMFHSSDTVCGAMMARSKAISGGPVYLSDSPDDFVKEHIYPLIDEKGKLFRPNAPAVPMPESIITNPLWDKKAYRVFAPVGDEAMSVICYNLNVDRRNVTAAVSKSDYLLRNAFTDSVGAGKERILIYDWEEQSARELTGSFPVRLKGFADRLFHLCPIIKGWAVIGIQEKYLSPATVEIISRTDTSMELNVRCAGTLKIWIEKGKEQGIREISVDKPGKIKIDKSE